MTIKNFLLHSNFLFESVDTPTTKEKRPCEGQTAMAGQENRMQKQGVIE